ncbi:MAG: hypothetical protein JWN07_2212 [Hyphomicrobiales bacterium]|nr:hypothetical protein [Hyphomicrobiales bacterium]
MARYEVRFLKDVCNDTGRAACVLQHVIAIEAADALRAQDEACTLFCLHEKVGHWRDHADRVDVIEIALPVRIRRRPS